MKVDRREFRCGAPGFHTQPEPSRRFKNQPKFNEKTPRERDKKNEMGAGEGKSTKFWAPHPSGPHFFWDCGAPKMDWPKMDWPKMDWFWPDPSPATVQVRRRREIESESESGEGSKKREGSKGRGCQGEGGEGFKGEF